MAQLVYTGQADNLLEARLSSIAGAEFSGEAYGVVAGVAVDQSAAVQSTLTAAGNAGGGRVTMPQGVVWLGAAISIPSDVLLDLAANGTILKVLAGFAGGDNIVKFENVNDAGITGGILDGNQANTTGTFYGIYFGTATNCFVSGVRVKDFRGDGIHGFNSDGLLITRNICSGSIYHGIEIEACTNSVVANNRATSNSRNGIYVYEGLTPTGCHGLTVNGNTFDSNGQYGIGVQGRANDSISISSNISRDNTQYGISLYDTDKITVGSNTLIGNGYHGIYLYRARYNSIIGNILVNNCQAANATYKEIFIDSDGVTFSRYNDFTGNIIVITGAIKATYALAENSANDGPNYVFGGYMDAGTAGKVNLLNASSRARYVMNVADAAITLADIAGGTATGSGYELPDLTVTGSLTVQGGMSVGLTVVTKNANYTLVKQDQIVYVDTSLGNVTITLDTIADCGVKEVYIEKVTGDANTVTILAGGTDTLDSATVLANQYDHADFLNDGTSAWHRTDKGLTSVAAANVQPGDFPAGAFNFHGATSIKGGSFSCDSSTPATFNNQVSVNSHFYGKAYSFGSITGTPTIYSINGNYQYGTLTGNVTLTLNNFVNGGVYFLLFTQDATGGRTITWPANVVLPSGGLGLSTAANSGSLIKLTGMNGKLYAKLEATY